MQYQSAGFGENKSIVLALMFCLREKRNDSAVGKLASRMKATEMIRRTGEISGWLARRPII